MAIYPHYTYSAAPQFFVCGCPPPRDTPASPPPPQPHPKFSLGLGAGGVESCELATRFLLFIFQAASGWGSEAGVARAACSHARMAL